MLLYNHREFLGVLDKIYDWKAYFKLGECKDAWMTIKSLIFELNMFSWVVLFYLLGHDKHPRLASLMEDTQNCRLSLIKLKTWHFKMEFYKRKMLIGN